MKSPRLAIIILHYKNLSDTRACLQSLRKIDYPNCSVILVNNDSPDHGRALADEFGDFISLIQNKENLGFAAGNNAGIAAGLADKSVDAVLILNNDTTVEPNFLSEMVQTLTLPSPSKGEGIIGMIAPRMLQFNDKNKIDNLGLVLMASGLPFNRHDENEKLFCPSGGAALYKRKLLETVGLFDPLFFAYCEDIDLGWRARNAGFACGYAAKAVVYHKGSAASSKMSDLAVYSTYRNLIWTQFKNLPLSLLLWQAPWLAAGWLFLFALYTAKGRPGVICKAFFDGLLGLRFIINRRREAQKLRAASNKTILSWFARGLFPRSYL